MMHISLWGFWGFWDGWYHLEETNDILEHSKFTTQTHPASNTSTVLLLTNVWQRLPNVSISQQDFSNASPCCPRCCSLCCAPVESREFSSCIPPTAPPRPSGGSLQSGDLCSFLILIKCLESHSVHKNILIFFFFLSE